MNDLSIPTTYVNQNTFPGCVIECTWTQPEAIEKLPFYATAIYLYEPVPETMIEAGAVWIKVAIEDRNYSFSKENWNLIEKLVSTGKRKLELDSKTRARGFSCPHATLEYFAHFKDLTNELLFVPAEKTRMLWIEPGLDASGHYRSLLPSRYMNEQHPEFYRTRIGYATVPTLMWHQAVILHRVPNASTLAVCIRFKNMGNVLVYEWDDDLYSVPKWNHNSKFFTPEVLNKVREAIEESDLILCSTQGLVDLNPEKSLLAPNLINFLEMNHRHEHRELKSAENPIRILWAGSNTHDVDLNDYVEAVKVLIEKYKGFVNFVFFGFCPREFLGVQAGDGNTELNWIVRPDYQDSVTFLPGVPYKQYKEALHQIDPDIAVCPLIDDPFNTCKSNLKLLEMGSMGIPVICSDAGPYRMLREFGMEHCLVDQKDVQGWINKLELLINEREMRVDEGVKMYELVYDNFSWQTDSPQRRYWDIAFERIRELVQERNAQGNQEANDPDGS